MAEYIERQKVFDSLPIVIEDKTITLYGAVADFMVLVSAIPAADVAPVVHGKWIPCDPDSDVRFYCSECGTEISTSWDYDCDEMWNGCPHCLARMDGDPHD